MKAAKHQDQNPVLQMRGQGKWLNWLKYHSFDLTITLETLFLFPSTSNTSCLFEEVCFILNPAVLESKMAFLSYQVWGSSHFLYIYCHLYWKPLELFSGKKIVFPL